MQVSSDLTSAAKSFPAVSLSEGARPTEELYVEDEEFPADLPVDYDWMLQAGAQQKSRRILGVVVVMLAALVLAVSVYVLHDLSRSSALIFASPSSSSR